MTVSSKILAVLKPRVMLVQGYRAARAASQCLSVGDGMTQCTAEPIISRQTFLTLRVLMSYIYIYIYIYIYMEHLFLMFLDHTQRRSTVGRTPLNE